VTQIARANSGVGWNAISVCETFSSTESSVESASKVVKPTRMTRQAAATAKKPRLQHVHQDVPLLLSCRTLPVRS
jgi:hypothetical protein